MVLPKSVGIIMDGNGRWAKKNGLPVKIGHRRGASALEKIVKYASDIGIEYLIVYAFSTENWKRSKEEVDNLMMLFSEYLDKFDESFSGEDIRVRVIGRREKLSEKLQRSIENVEQKTKDRKGLTFVIALDYGGREEIVSAVKKIANSLSEGDISVNDINEELVAKNMYTNDILNPDIIVRTSGEKRLSNFLMWQSAYSELYFMDVLWPDFTKDNFDDVINEYHKRDRRLGGR